MAELRASPVVNPSYKRIADVLANLQGPMGEIIPFTDANPFKFLMPAASTFENLAYGNSPLSEYAGVTNRRLPIVKTGRENELTDIADVALMASGLPMASRGVARGANYLGDVLTQATRAAPPAAPMRALDEIARMSPVPQAMSGSRDLIRSSADNLAQELNGLGFQAKVQHSGSRAGPSSYVQIYDPETGRFFTKPIRFSGHGKGPFEAAGVIDVQDPTTDIPNIVQEALQMRGMGPSATLQKQAQKQAIADELIAGGMKPKKAYAEAEKKIAGLLEPQAGATKTPPEVPKSLLDNPNLRNWVKGSEAVKESGEPITLYHATTHDFDTFSLNRANPENHYGRGFYLTDSVDDANLNYAGIGPDLEIRIERRTEQLADELMDMDAEEIADMAKSLEVDDSLIDVAKIEKSGASLS
jgi:hypothetical protein